MEGFQNPVILDLGLDDESKKFNFIPWIVGAGALLLLANKFGATSVDANKNDISFLTSASATELRSKMAEDNTEWFYTSPGNTPRTAEQTAAIMAALHKRYVTDSQLGQLSIPPNMLGDVVLRLLDIENKDVRTETLDLFMTMFDKWNVLFASTIISVGNALGAITSAAGENIIGASECTGWTWTKNQVNTSNETAINTTTVSKMTGTTRIAFGILGSQKTSSSFYQVMQENSLDQSQSISFTPHCTSTQPDLVKIEAILIAQSMAIKPLYQVIQGVINMAPTLNV